MKRIVNGKLRPARPVSTADRLDRLGRQYRATEIKHTAWQTWIAIAALVASSVLAFIAYQNQQSVSRSQIEVNKAQQEIMIQQQDRSLRRYVDRVAWWDEYSLSLPNQLTVHIQNRTTGPVRGVELFNPVPKAGDDQSNYASLYVGDMPPCEAVTFVIKWSSGTKYGTLLKTWSTAGLYMQDPSSRGWLKTVENTNLISGKNEFINPRIGSRQTAAFVFPAWHGRFIHEFLLRRTDLADCGEPA